MRLLPEHDSDELMVAAGMATFQTSLLLCLLFLLRFRADGLDELLAGLSTLGGIAAFALLWTTTFYCTLKVVHRLGLDNDEMTIHLPSQAAFWGAVNGAAVFIIPVLLLLPGSFVIAWLRNEDGLSLQALLFILPLTLVVGGLFAGAVGAFVGLAFGALTSGLWSLARMLVPRRTFRLLSEGAQPPPSAE